MGGVVGFRNFAFHKLIFICRYRVNSIFRDGAHGSSYEKSVSHNRSGLNIEWRDFAINGGTCARAEQEDWDLSAIPLPRSSHK